MGRLLFIWVAGVPMGSCPFECHDWSPEDGGRVPQRVNRGRASAAAGARGSPGISCADRLLRRSTAAARLLGLRHYARCSPAAAGTQLTGRAR